MNDIQKLKHLVEHWKEHNEEHAKTYLEWAEKADRAGERKLADVLRELSEGTMKLGELLERAGGLL